MSLVPVVVAGFRVHQRLVVEGCERLVGGVVMFSIEATSLVPMHLMEMQKLVVELTMRVQQMGLQTRDADALQMTMEMQNVGHYDVDHVAAEVEMGNLHAMQEEAWHELVVELHVLLP